MLRIRYVSKRKCFHHDHRSGESWISEQMIDMGMRKMFWCRACDKSWIS